MWEWLVKGLQQYAPLFYFSLRHFSLDIGTDVKGNGVGRASYCDFVHVPKHLTLDPEIDVKGIRE